MDKLFLRVFAGVDFCDSSQLRVRSKNEVNRRARPFDFAAAELTGFEQVRALWMSFPFDFQVHQVHKEVIAQCLRTLS